MSRYRQITETYSKAVREGWALRTKYFEFTKRLIDGFLANFEIPSNRVRYLPVEGEPENGKSYGIAGATAFREDGWFEAHFSIECRPDQPPYAILNPLGFRFAVRQTLTTDGWDVRTAAAGPQCRVADATEERDLERCYDALFAALGPWLEGTLEDAKEEGESDHDRVRVRGFELRGRHPGE